MVSPQLLLLKNFTIRLFLFLEKKHPQNFIFQNHKFTSPISYHSHYSLNHLFTIGTIRNYDPVKQCFILSSYHDPTRPLFVPQEALNVNDDFLLPTHIPNAVPNFFPKMNKLMETPLDDHSRSLYTALIHKHYSLAQLSFIIAKLQCNLQSLLQLHSTDIQNLTLSTIHVNDFF